MFSQTPPAVTRIDTATAEVWELKAEYVAQTSTKYFSLEVYYYYYYYYLLSLLQS